MLHGRSLQSNWAVCLYHDIGSRSSHRFCQECKKENNHSSVFERCAPSVTEVKPRSLGVSFARQTWFCVNVIITSSTRSVFACNERRRAAKHDNCAEEYVIVPRCAKESSHVTSRECSNFSTSLISQLSSFFLFLRNNRSTGDPDRSIFFASFRSSTANFACEWISEVSKQVTCDHRCVSDKCV